MTCGTILRSSSCGSPARQLPPFLDTLPMLQFALILLCTVALAAADPAIPGPLHGVKLGMDRKACLAVLQRDVNGYGNRRDTYAMVQEGSWQMETDQAAPEVRDFLRNHGYTPLDLLCLQQVQAALKYRCTTALWVLMSGGRCDRLLYVVNGRPEDSLDVIQRRIETTLGAVFPPMQASERAGTVSASIRNPTWSGRAWRRTAEGMNRLVVEVCLSTARPALSAEELQKREAQERERLTIKPSDEALLERMRMPVEVPPQPVFRTDLLTAEEYAERAQKLRLTSAFEKHLASGRGVFVARIDQVNRDGQGAKLGLRRLDSILSIDGIRVTDYLSFTHNRNESAPEQELSILSVGGDLRTVRVGPGKIGIQICPGGVSWSPITYMHESVRGPWDEDAITALLAESVDLDVTEQALAKAIEKGWQDPLAHQLAGVVLASQGRWREAVESIKQSEAAYVKRSDFAGQARSRDRVVELMSAAGWTKDAVQMGVGFTLIKPDALNRYVAALRDLPPGDAQRDLSRTGLALEPRYPLRPFLRALEAPGLDVELARRLCETGRSDLPAVRGFRSLAWEGFAEHGEVEFTFETTTAYIWNTNTVTFPDLRLGLAHVRENGKLESTRLFANFYILSNGEVLSERRDVGTSFYAPSSFRLNGKGHHFRFVRWGSRVRLEINGISAGETMVDPSRLGTTPRLVLWMETTHPATSGVIRDFQAVGFGETPAIPLAPATPDAPDRTAPPARVDPVSDF